MRKNTLEGLKDQLNPTSKISIISHKNPDGDALGSSLALHLFLKQLEIPSQVIMPNNYPDFLKWLPNNQDILFYDSKEEECKAALEASDFIFTLDFNHLNRVGSLGDYLKDLEATFVMIDHHQEPSDYANYMLVDTQIASTCELIYEFITSQYPSTSLSADVGSCLYTGIMTDTGSFRFPSTTSKTHRIIANLIDAGANNSQIHQHIYDSNNISRLHLLGVALNNLKVIEEFNTAYIYLSQEDLNSNDFRKGDTEGFVNYGLSIKGIKFAVIFIEHKAENIIKISLRSIGDFNVNAFARKHFSGGGHNNAAGGKSDLDLKSTLAEFETTLKHYKDDLS